MASAQGNSRLIGRVVDPDGKPIADVVVTATCREITSFKEIRKTDKKGTFIVDFRHLGVTYHYRFERPGFAPLEVDQRWDLEGTQRFEWKMAPAAAAPAAALPASTSEPAVIRYNEGVSAVRLKDYATAEAKFRESVQHDPKLARAWAALSTVQVQLGRNGEAAESAEKAMALGLKDEVVLTSRWQAYKNLGDEVKAAEALKDLESVGRLAEEAKRIHNEAVALVKAGDNAAAFAKFQEALKIDPALQPALVGLATSGLKIGRNQEAAAAAEAVLKEDPQNEQAIRLRYNACLRLEDGDRLFEALVGLIAVEPDVAGKGMLKLAFDAYDANDRSRAKQRFVKVLDVYPDQPLVHYYLGLIYVSEGANADAKRHLERFVQLAPNSTEAATAREVLKQIG
jgi:Tfp pilus assembly protein PilF